MAEEIDGEPLSCRALLQSWLNKIIKVKISDGRRLIGSFLCTDQEMNIILGSCQEYVYSEDFENEEPRILGLAMIPGKHIVSLELDQKPESEDISTGMSINSLPQSGPGTALPTVGD